MAATKGVPNRRKSIAVTSNQNDPIKSTRRKRAHSIAPGERLSPVSKARRSLAPRKSILKASLNFPGDDIQLEDETESGEFTRDFKTDIRDNTTRRASFARRVSFAEHAHVRVFNKDNNNTNSTASPQSSPANEVGPSAAGVTNENAYPGSTTLAKRRSSIRRSAAFSDDGEESMDMDMDETAPGPSAFMFARGDSAVVDDMDDDDDEEDYDGDDMEMTEAISQNIIRKRSLSIGLQPRRPLSNVPQDYTAPHDNHDHPSSEPEPDQSFSGEDTTSTDADRSQPLEYTVPLVKPPAPPSNAWLALRSVTHSGDEPYEATPSDDEGGEQDMELTNAIERLRAAGSLAPQHNEQADEDSFASTNDSFDDDNNGDQTINVTSLIRRASTGAVTDADSTMDVTGDYGAGIVEQAGRLSVGPVHAQAAASSVPQPPKPNVFSAPTPLSPSKQNKPPASQATVPKPFNFTFTPKSHPQVLTSPSKTQPTKIPTAASFTPAARSSPKKRSAPVDENQNINEDIEPADRPSPAKKPAVSGRWPDSSTPGATAKPALPSSASKTPSRLSPSKKTPFSTVQDSSEPKRPSIPLRRPSGYFAQRKSLGAGVSAPFPTTQNDVGGRKSPKKAGRMSIGHGHASVKFDIAAEKEKVQREEARDQHVESSPAGPLSTAAPHTSRQSSPAIEQVQNDDMEVEIVNPAAQWREDVQEQSYSEDAGPPISIEQFFNVTGIRFMDEITAPRRSTVHPSALRPRRHSSPSSGADSDIPLSEYVTAMSVDVPQLELYTHVSKDLEAWIERSKEIFKEAEEEAEKITPELFREFVGAAEDGQAELLHQLKLIKANTHGNAKSEWYDWKLQWVEQLYGKAEKGFDDITADAGTLEIINTQAQALVPSLREEYEQVIRELEQEKAFVAEIENSDQKYLNELKMELSEQNDQLETYRGELADGNAKLERMEEKLKELISQKQEASGAIEQAQRLLQVQKGSTRAEVFRLKDELESLENLHLWRASKIQPDLLELIYAATYRVSITCANFTPQVEKLDIRRLEKMAHKFKDPFPHLTDLMLRMAKHIVIREEGILSVRQIVQRLGDYWSSCAQLRSQLKLVAIKYPLTIDNLPTLDSTSGFKATATVVIPSVKAKALVSFILDTETFASWPMSISATKCEVEVAYGPIDRDTILNAVIGRLGQASPAENHACLLDACIEAVDQCVS